MSLENFEQKYRVKFFEKNKQGNLLFWLGTQHSKNIEHPQFEEIKSKWSEFLSKAENPLVVLEGWPIEPVFETEQEATRHRGEPGLISFLAYKNSIPIKYYEPDRQKEMDYLAEAFGKDKTAYYYFSRTLAQYYKLKEKGSAEDYLLPYFRRDKKISQWQGFDFDIDNFKSIHEKLFNKKFDINDADWFIMACNPYNDDGLLQELALTCGVYRDKAIVEGINNSWKDHDVFVVYGNGHMEAHEEGLEKALTKIT